MRGCGRHADRANLTRAEVQGATFYRDSYNGVGSGITTAQLYSTASYQTHNLTGIDLGGNELTGVSLAGQNLANAKFYGAMMTAADFSQSDLTNALFSVASLADANFSQANLSGANFAYDEYGYSAPNLTVRTSVKPTSRTRALIAPPDRRESDRGRSARGEFSFFPSHGRRKST